MNWMDTIKHILRDRFYDKVEVGGSFTFTKGSYTEDIYHVLEMSHTNITYQKTWYGYRLGSPVTVTRTKFKNIVQGSEYHGEDYLYSFK